MTKTHITIVILILSSIFLGYLLLEKKQENSVISIPQIQIIQKKEAVKEEPKTVQTETPDEILSRLKMAVSQSKQNLELSEEEQAKAILERLKKQTHLTSSTEEKVRKALDNITKKVQIQKSNNKTIKKPKTINTQIKKVSVKENYIEHTLDSIQEILHEKKSPNIIKKVTHKKVIHKKKTNKKPTLKHHVKQPQQSTLSREEEVAQYKKASANGLEVVGVSNLFEIDAPNTRPDADYFEPIATTQQNSHEPIGFVKTLGVVEVSQKYEVGNLEIPQMVELAKEGVVDISSASVETEALKKLKFIDPLEVVEVSEAFETIEANRYIK